jgi:hypothetical protein
MRNSKHGSPTDKAAGQPSKLRKGGTESFYLDKENLPANDNKALLMNIIEAQKTAFSVSGTLKQKTSPRESPLQGSKNGSKIDISLIRNSGLPSSPNERRKRCLTPKTLKELLGERRKLGFGQRSPTELERKKPITLRITEILAQSKFKGQESGQKESILLNAPSCPGSPGPTADQFVQTKGNNYELMRRQGGLVTSHCINHSQKRSEYTIVEDKKVSEIDGKATFARGLCSRCAVKVANAGFKVEELEEDSTEEQKTVEFSQFIGKVAGVTNMASCACREIQHRRELLVTHYARQAGVVDSLLLQLEATFKSACTVLADAKRTLTEDAQQRLKTLLTQESAIKQHQNDLQLFSENLGQNFQETIKVMDLGNLKSNIRRFEQQLLMIGESCRKSISTRLDAAVVHKIEAVKLKEFQDLAKHLLELTFQPIAFRELEPYTEEFNNLQKSLVNSEASSVMQKASQASVYVSFDGSQIPVPSPSSLLAGMKNCPPTDLCEALVEKSQGLKRITESASKQDSIYDSFSQCLGDDPLFILSPTEADFVAKQTPELGHKTGLPVYLQEHLASIRQASALGFDVFAGKPSLTAAQGRLQSQADVSTYSSATVSGLLDIDELFQYIGNRKIPESLGFQANQCPTKCQKVLFSEKGILAGQSDEDSGLDEGLLSD